MNKIEVYGHIANSVMSQYKYSGCLPWNYKQTLQRNDETEKAFLQRKLRLKNAYIKLLTDEEKSLMEIRERIQNETLYNCITN